MTSDAKLILQCLFDTVWQLFTSWDVPGTNVTPAEFIFFLLFAGISLRFLFRILGLDLSDVPTIREPPSHSVPSSSAAPRLNAPGRNRGVFGYGPGWGFTHRD